MTSSEAKQKVLNMEPDFLQKAPKVINGYTSYICPVCGNGAGENGAGIVLYDNRKGGRYYKCFSCDLHEDVVGLWKISRNIADDKEAFRTIYKYAGIDQIDTEEQYLPAEKNLEEKPDDNTEYYKKCADREKFQMKSNLEYLQNFLQEVSDSRNAPCYSSGFSYLDDILDGGFYAGLYIIGAVSSLGKSTFILQCADNIAKQGEDVLIFSLEMSKKELVSKSVSRITYELTTERRQNSNLSKNTRGIMTGKLYDHYSIEEKQLIEDSVRRYGEYAGHIYMLESVRDENAESIREKVQNYIRANGKVPVVVIDYLQIMAPINDHYTDKQNIDKNVLELKRLSKEENVPIIGISSFNRENYMAPANFSSFKESGSIEYCSDCLIALQYSGMDYLENEDTKAREKRVRDLQKEAIEAGKRGEEQKIQLKVLKNRNGKRGDAYFSFYPIFNYFKEDAVPDDEENIKSGNILRGDSDLTLELLENAFMTIQKDGKATLTELADLMCKSERSIEHFVKRSEDYSLKYERKNKIVEKIQNIESKDRT